ncbi:MAG: MFS transporter [Proteobacteria bacterium]|nr:MFS transporter [Pseudomonadota bacterium]MBU1450206.1 MFS transporter [Pseudomonadota bacterium]MBU2517303.1 MFS transporter [Pseudomonadota bacterium]
MAHHWQATFGVDRAAVGQIIFFLLAGVGTTMYLAGRWQERLGPARLVRVGSVISGLAALALPLAPGIGAIHAWAFITGASQSCLYLPALSVVQRWFPLRRGLVAGLVSMVFGLAAAATAPLFSFVLAEFGPTPLCLGVGLAAMITGLAAAPFISFPVARPQVETAGHGAPGPSLRVGQATRTRAFWVMWFTWALAGSAGIAMVTLSTTFGLSRGLGLRQAVVLLTAFNLTNGLSRLASGWLSDLAGRNLTMAAAFFAAGIAYLLLPQVQGLYLWAGLAAVVGFAFGTLFSVSAPLATDCFGLEHFGAIFGLVFTAYGFLAGALGPWLGGHLLDVTGGDFSLVFGYLGCFMLVSAGLIFLARPPRA